MHNYLQVQKHTFLNQTNVGVWSIKVSERYTSTIAYNISFSFINVNVSTCLYFLILYYCLLASAMSYMQHYADCKNFDLKLLPQKCKTITSYLENALLNIYIS